VWRTSGAITIHPDGNVTGVGRARLRGWGCDFTVAQVQTKLVRLTVSGARSGDRIAITFSISGSTPVGSQDLGGFTATVEHLGPKAEVTGGHAGAGTHLTSPDGDLGRYTNESEIQLDCAVGC
jgi:hypothetical protein